MLEKINAKGYETISEPCYQMIELIKEFKKNNRGKISVAEVGVGIGATSVEITKLLSNEDDFYILAFEDEVTQLKKELLEQEYCNTNIYDLGNSRKTYDSYCWSLAKMYQELSDKEIFDLVYLDGAHSFFHDGLACCILKKMIKKDGVLVFDDMGWSYANSPSLNPQRHPEVLNDYTMEQIKTCQIAMVVELFMKDDEKWQLIEELSNSRRATYRKIK